MKRLLLLLLIVLPCSATPGDDKMLMAEFGVYRFTGVGFDVTVELKERRPGELAPTITFQEGGSMARTGIGKGAGIPVVEGNWAAQFLPPHELWIYDGNEFFQLYERTIDPTGFKGSSSTVVPNLIERAPKALRDQHSEKKSG